MIISLFLSIAHAKFGQTTLSAGSPDFKDCLDNSNCIDDFYRFLTHSMLEQGFAIEGRSLLANPALTKQENFVFGTSITTFPFSPPQKNLSGKEENTSFSPVFPRFHGHYIQDDKKNSYGIGILPPIPIKGASVLFTSLHYVRLISPQNTFQIDGSFAHILAPITASEEQFEDKENFSNPDNLNDSLYQERCASQENGCIDQYNIVHTSGSWLHTWTTTKTIQPYTQLGVTALYERLYVMYDDTTWEIFSLQPVGTGGVSWSNQNYFCSIGASLAPQFPQQNRDSNFGAFYRLDAQFSYSWN